MNSHRNHWQTVIIGGGQAGLALGYFLKKKNHDFLILDENQAIGDSWRKRWESLKLFTPARHDGLPGMPFPADRGSFPTKDQVADFLKYYASTYSLPLLTGTRVNNLSALDGHFHIDSSGGKFISENVVLATGTNPVPKQPSFAPDLDDKIFQLHSAEYTSPESLPQGDVLVVGAGTSGAEIALEVSREHKTYIAGNPTLHIPDNVFKYAGELYWLFISNILTVRTPVGRKARGKILRGGAPLIRISVEDLDKAGVVRCPRMSGVKDGMPLLSDGRILNVSAVIWCTGYKPDFNWINIDITNGTGWPVTKQGVSLSVKGLYTVGMPFQFGLTSGLIGGVGRDVRYISSRLLKG